MLFLTKGQAAPHAITALVALSILIYFTVVQKRASTGDLAQENDALPARTLAKLSIPFVRSHQIASLGRHGRRGSDKHAGVRDARVNDRDATRTSSSTLPDILRHLVGPPTLADRNDTAGRSFLSKRADLNFDEYVCKGESGLVKMRAARPDPPQFRFRDLQRNGWVIDIGQPPTTIGIDVEQALFELDIPWGTNSYVNFIARLKNRFVNIHGESKEPLGQGGTYNNLYIPAGEKSTIIALDNNSPRSSALEYFNDRDPALLAAIPPMHNWANVVWALWDRGAGDQAGTLRYIFHDHVITDTTQHLMEKVEGMENDERSKELKLPWPGHTYKMDDRRGLALLGSPHGMGTVWMYLNGRAKLGVRNNIQVTIFTGQYDENLPTPYDAYYMLWDLGPRS
ncbi:MAG: hypothetical protein L6R39_001382 [Caloplaca ligustica]|nr:MAG: hypothetical protein L6R39_001382 [Caloplaca ligustica]